VHQNLVFDSREEARAIARGDLSLACCASCGFVFNAAFDESKLAYGHGYDNTQACSPTFMDHMRELADSLVADPSIAEGHVVEVGCGAGTFLRLLADLAHRGFSAEGFDPAYRGPESERNGRLRFVSAFFGAETMSRPAAAVISRHVIEHIPEPVSFLAAMRNAATRGSGGHEAASVWIETPSIEWILEYGAVWDLFYEHCSYFSPGSIAVACAHAGLAVRGAREVFGGQYMWLEAAPAADPRVEPHEGTLDLARAFGERMTQFEEHLRSLVAGTDADAPTFLWGAGAKGVTVANLIDSDCATLTAVVDMNPRKQGRWLPGTGHPIVGPEGLADAAEGRVIVMNANYLPEIRSTIESIDATVEVAALEGVA